MFLGYPYLPVGLLLSSPFSIIGLSVSTTLTNTLLLFLKYTWLAESLRYLPETTTAM